MLALTAFTYRIKLKKELIFKAMYHWSTSSLAKLFGAWYLAVKRLTAERDRLFLRMLNNPTAIRCLMILAGFDISSLLKRKGKENSVDERMIRVALTKSYQKGIFKALKSMVYRDGVKLS